MSVEIITKEDLQHFRRQLLEDLQQLLSKRQPTQTQKQVLKSAEVRKLLKISPATLQSLRINGTLPFSKIGGTIYYRQEDIEKLMEGNKSNNQTAGL
ncbi:helix-turn-helix domain-containing protein [Pontibacter qinzhouensis]|uniref:Helix-turn-helix domain-containing protein n=1 Tax=Pontibacter qinzhouensis TaxID=2603253 RepID=A0A5C8K631_9BACT|nr:helix-turn-helix domain-containing protein [Pontibacter qinzhouensis]TXK45721.1 helix-turn-helix domain-containing protein [Pontibacter qinzhouensis]